MITFNTYVNNQAKQNFREEQFFAHSFNRALSEAEWTDTSSPEELAEAFKQITLAKAIPHRSDHPEYNKELAYRHYGSPVEDKEATAKAVADHTAATGKAPGKAKTNALKVFTHNHDPKKAGGVLGIIRNYGHPDKEPIADEARKAEAESNFDSFSAIRKSNPAEYIAKVKAAKAKFKNSKAPIPLKNTTKGDTVAELRGDNESEKNGHISLGFSGTPDIKKHTVNDKGDYIETSACHGKGNCVHHCLAKGGCGGFETTKGYRGSYDQLDSHNADSRHDFDLLMHHQLHGISKKAKKLGMGAVVRPDTTTGHQAYTHSEAIAKHFGGESEHYKSGAGQKVKVNTYGKTIGTDKDTHNMTANNINITASDQGIPASKGALKAHEALTQALREKGAPSATNRGSRIGFTVVQVAHPRTPEGMSDEDYIKHAKHSNPLDQADYEKAKSITKVRRYDISHSKPEAGEAEEYHNDKSQSGRVVHQGKSYKYTDHDVPAPMETKEGKMSPTYMHDNRGGELTRHHQKHPNAHGINAIAMATSSTNIHNTEVGKSIFHPTRNIDNNGILHVMHQAAPESENARKILAK